MTAAHLLALFALSMAALFAWSWWLDRHARYLRKTTRRMVVELDRTAEGIGAVLAPAFQQTIDALREFAAALAAKDTR